MSPAPPRVGVFGYFGMGNIGNEATLTAFLAALRARHPGVEVRAFVAGPDEVEREHGVSATRLMTYRPSRTHPRPVDVTLKALSRLWDVPRTFRAVGSVDVLVVPGTGVLETTLLAQPWSLPYWMFLAVACARLRGRRVALVAVGAEPAGALVTRALHAWTVRLAHHVSYRDAASRAAMEQSGAPRKDAAVYPDLAFGLPAPAPRPRRRDLVVLGVMRYGGALGEVGVERYTAAMTDAVCALVDSGKEVRTIVGDVADLPLAHEIATRARSRGAVAVDVSAAVTMTGLMEETAVAGVVVASRFHNVIAALLAGAPVVSLGYAEKNARLLREVGQEGTSQRIDHVEVDRLLRAIEGAAASSPQARDATLGVLEGYRKELDDLYRVLSTLVDDR